MRLQSVFNLDGFLTLCFQNDFKMVRGENLCTLGREITNKVEAHNYQVSAERLGGVSFSPFARDLSHILH